MNKLVILAIAAFAISFATSTAIVTALTAPPPPFPATFCIADQC
jgi:hypothetical protein